MADLSRDVANANPGLEKIFGREKEPRRVDTLQAVVDIGPQVSDIVRAEGEIAATKKATDALNRAGPDELRAEQKQWQKANPNKTPTQGDIVQQLYQTSYNKAMLDSDKGRGGAPAGHQRGNVAGAVAGGAAPYLAELIHKATTAKDANGKEVVNVEAHLIAHAVLSAAGEYIVQQLCQEVDLTVQT